jgi:hypothetical protein
MAAIGKKVGREKKKKIIINTINMMGSKQDVKYGKKQFWDHLFY